MSALDVYTRQVFALIACETLPRTALANVSVMDVIFL